MKVHRVVSFITNPTRLFAVYTIFFLSLFSSALAKDRTDLVIFSYDRPLQLYALLESIDVYVTGLNKTIIIYRTSKKEFAQSYEVVKKEFPNVEFMQQGRNPVADFKPLTMQAIFGSSGDYITFAVDDDVITGFIDINECVRLIEQTGVYAFYLRLGNNITECYSLNKKTSVPPHVKIEDGVYQWRFGDGRGDWRYPHTVEMAIFKKESIRHNFMNMNFKNPNSLEARWAGRANLNLQGLFFAKSTILGIPMNLVQNEYNNRHMHGFSTEELLEIFNKGLKMDIKELFEVKNPAPHFEHLPTFIPR